ncbi:hypothetical protein VZT92_016007 [Zoarces viviparus]|uniref:Calcineurin-like phosphoesterase domain-containing protein n=1 Tax=Zoarces viviparus TaxID=48416 RepID=A0AAW1ESJ8_ZOAVI
MFRRRPLVAIVIMTGAKQKECTATGSRSAWKGSRHPTRTSPCLLRDCRPGCPQCAPTASPRRRLAQVKDIRGTLPYDIKIVIAGNHELTFDQEFMADLIKQDFYYFPSASKLKPENYENVQSLLTNCIYLQDSDVTVRGFKIYGSPW